MNLLVGTLSAPCQQLMRAIVGARLSKSMTNKWNSYLREALAAADGLESRILIPPFPGSNPGAPAS